MTTDEDEWLAANPRGANRRLAMIDVPPFADGAVAELRHGPDGTVIADIRMPGVTEPGRWENAEELDFYVESARSANGTVWIRLVCSECGPVQATAEGEPSDLGCISVAAQGHYEREHVHQPG